MTADPFDERNVPTTTRRRELADRIGTWRLYYGGDLFWALVIVALFVIGAVFVGNVVRAEAIDDTAATVHEVADRPDVEHAKPGWLALTGCDLMEWHFDAVGLPDEFDWIGFGESSCRNDVISPTGCCFGYAQAHTIHIGQPHTAHCDVFAADDMFGANPIARSKNACMAKAIFDLQGFCAWDVYAKRTGRCR